MNVLLSIKPKYVESIMNGEKRYEFRKSIFRREGIDRVYIYSTSPIKKIVGAFNIGDIIEGHPSRLWEECGEYSGLTEFEFFRYFNGKKRVFAIKIEGIKNFNNPIDPREIFPNFVPPQSFCYVDMPIVPGGTKNGKNKKDSR